MKLEFLNRPESERTPFLQETAARRGLLPVMVEKDFWVSWALAALFAHPEFGRHLVFKGGTSLSKVFGVIDRFSEDIDLSVSPSFLGISEEWVEEAGSRKRTEARMHELESACIWRVRDRFLPELERIAIEALGNRIGGRAWMKFEEEDSTGSPVVLFHYPSASPAGFEYLARFVKMEFGALTDQRPVGSHLIRPWVADEFPKQFGDFHCEVVALELERTFWEKATILHAEHHRDPAKPMRALLWNGNSMKAVIKPNLNFPLMDQWESANGRILIDSRAICVTLTAARDAGCRVNPQKEARGAVFPQLADREGFEPSVSFHPHTLSKRAH